MTGPRRLPQRSCVGCGATRDKKELLRVVRTPEGEVLLDATGKKNGRGAYLCRSAACLARAQKRHSLSRALQADIPSEIYERLEKEMRALETE